MVERCCVLSVVGLCPFSDNLQNVSPHSSHTAFHAVLSNKAKRKQKPKKMHFQSIPGYSKSSYCIKSIHCLGFHPSRFWGMLVSHLESWIKSWKKRQLLALKVKKQNLGTKSHQDDFRAKPSCRGGKETTLSVAPEMFWWTKVEISVKNGTWVTPGAGRRVRQFCPAGYTTYAPSKSKHTNNQITHILLSW